MSTSTMRSTVAEVWLPTFSMARDLDLSLVPVQFYA